MPASKRCLKMAATLNEDYCPGFFARFELDLFTFVRFEFDVFPLFEFDFEETVRELLEVDPSALSPLAFFNSSSFCFFNKSS